MFKSKKRLLIGVVPLFLLAIMPITVSAKNHSIDVTSYVCDPQKYNDPVETNNYKNCANDYIAGKMTSSYLRVNGDEIDPGSLMLFVVNYHVGSNHNVTGLNYRYYFDPNVWTPGVNSSGQLYTSTKITNHLKGTWPEYGEGVDPNEDDDAEASNWDNTPNVNTNDNYFSTTLVNGVNNPFYEDAKIGLFFMRLSDTASGTVGLTTGTTYPRDASMNDFNGKKNTIDFGSGSGSNFSYGDDYTGISFSVAGSAQSTDATLGTITATNAGTDYFKPTFVSGSDTLNYTIYVPYSVTSIDLQATTHDGEAIIGDEFGTGLGVKNLDVGAQVYNITVYSEAGNSLTYAITVYRLNNDATIKNVSFTNNVGFPQTNSSLQNTFEYNTTVPFATKNTVASATIVDPNASIVSGTGTWNINSTGLNTFNIVTEAENCKYPLIQNNECTSKTYVFNITREEASTNKYISSITKAYTENGVKETASVLPGFVKTTKEYDLGHVSYETTRIDLRATAEDYGKAKITSSDVGEKSLQVGLNTFNIHITAEDGSGDVYTVTVYRESENRYLKNMNFVSIPSGHGSLNTPLVKTVLDGYRFNYDESATGYTVTATVEDTDKASVSIYNADGTIGSPSQLNSNSYTFDITTNKVFITVTAEDGKINTYEVNVGRSQSSDSTLDALDVSSGSGDSLVEYKLSPEFPDPSTRNYALTVGSDVSEVNIHAIPHSNFANIKEIRGNYTNLSFDVVNKIEVVVEAEDKSTSSYTIDITREKYSIKTLSDLNVTLDGNTYNIDPTLNDSDTTYSLVNEIPYSIDGNKVTQVVINATPTDETYASVTGVGQKNIHTGLNTFEITVTAHDKTKRVYTLNITQKRNTDNSISNFTVKGIAPTVKEELADTTVYEMEVENNVTSITPSDVVFTLPDGASKTVTQQLQLKTKQDNIYTFTVSSESGILHTYQVNVKRKSSENNNISLVTLTIGSDSSRTCVMDANNKCTFEVPVDTLAFSLVATIDGTATINPLNGTEYELPANTSTRNINLAVTAESGDVANYTVTVNRAKSSNNDLATLLINNQTISEITNNASTFNPNTTTYNITVDGTVSKAKVKGIVSDTDKAVINVVNATNGFNEANLEYVSNEQQDEFDLTQDKVNVIKVYVKAENNQVKYYTLNITRALRTNALLADLTYNGVTITGFEPTKDEYTLEDVIYNISSITIGAQTQDAQASVGGSGVRNITTGPNLIVVTVTAQDKTTTKDYKIHITRAKNSDTGIKGMTLAGVAAHKNNETGEYEVTVPNSVIEANHDNLVVTVNDPRTETDAKATVIFTDYALHTEDNNPNVMTITVKAENNTTKDYTLRITRTKSNIATLSSLDVTDEDGTVIGSYGTKPFVPNSFTPDEAGGINMTYEVSVPVDTTRFKISAVASEQHAVIVGDGVYDLDTTANDSVTTKTITVTSEDNNVVYNYVLKVSRAKSSDNRLKSITVTSEDGNTNYPLNTTFAPGTVNYTVNVAGDVEKVKLNAEVFDNRASIENEADTLKVYDLAVGDNIKTITVKSESGSPNTYTVNIIRALKPYNDLSSLTINSDTIIDTENSVNKFDNENKYTMESVSYNTTKVGYTYQNADDDASAVVKVKNEKGVVTTVEGNEINLSTGVNEITITVTAQNNDTQVYTVYITRSKNNDATLKTITVLNARGTTSEVITVTNETDTYYLTVDETKEKILASEVLFGKSDSKATVAALTDTNLVTSDAGVYPNRIEINVTAEDGETIKTYELLVRRPKSSDNRIKQVELIGASNESEFKDNVYTYTLDIPYNGDAFTILGIPYVSTTTVSGNYTYTYYLDDDKQPHLSYIDGEGDTQVIDGSQIILTAVAENGQPRNYAFNIKSAKTEDTVLNNLEVQDQPFTVAYTQTRVDYTIKNDIEMSQDAIRVIATPRNPKATYKCILDGNEYDCQNDNLPLPRVAAQKQITVVVTSASGTKSQNYYITYNKVYSTDADLDSLQMVEPEINLGFNKATTSYTTNVANEVESAKFRMKPSDANSKIFVNDVQLTTTSDVYEYTLENLVEGTNTLRIRVLAQDEQTENTYVVTVNKAAPLASDDATLSDLYVEGFNFTEAFSINKTEYDLGEIPFKTDSLTVIAEKNHAGATISYNLDGANGQESNTLVSPLEDGTRTIYVNVTAEDGHTFKSYSITYRKKASTNNKLSSVTLDNATLAFDPDTTSYNVDVDTDTKNMVATILVDDPKVTLKIGDTTYEAPNNSAIIYNLPTLSPGNNKLQIVVIPESNTPVNVYEININREKDEQITSIEFGHTIENGYIKTGILNETGLDLKNELDNRNEHLQIWNSDETVQISDSDKIATGYIVKLIVDDIEQDRKIIVVKGDVNGDGNITLNDAVLTINHYVGVRNNDSSKRRLVNEYLLAADSNVSGDITLNDAVLIINHYVGVRNNDPTKALLRYKR